MSFRLQEYADRQAEARPEAIALVCGTESISYGELAEKSNQLAKLLQENGCRHGDRLGILLPKSIDAILCMLGTLKAGAIYVPMDTSSPFGRLQMILESSGCSFVVASPASKGILQQLAPTVTRNPVKIIWASRDADCEVPVAFSWADLDSAASNGLPVHRGTDQIAHLLFTSGSTGKPKGVQITHGNVRHYIDWSIQYFDYSPEDRISGHPPLHFDLSTMDIYSAFAAGAQLHLVPPQVSLLPHKVSEFIRKSELTQWFSVPSLLAYMAKFDVVAQDDFPSLRRLLWCGERFPTPALMYWMKRVPHATFTNLYGPTEATIASSFYRVPKCPENEEQAIPIGQPCAGEQLYVLDEDLKPVADGVVGELYISGVGLSPGYWNDAEKTKAAFIDANFPERTERIYRTGDLASIGPDHLAYLHGRTDSQIKSRGYRIELGEIETTLHATEGVREAAVIGVDTGAFEGATICCAVVPEQGWDFQPQAIRQRLATKLPTYMLPARWLCFDHLPLNVNGKIDRPKLRQHFQKAFDLAPTEA